MSYAANPRAPKPDPSTAPQESTGAVASDSLAAESIRAGGEFAENEGAVPLGVRGDQSTLANTDTSGATALHSARDGAAREKQDAMGLGSDEKGVSGVKYPQGIDKPDFDGSTTAEGHYYGGPSATSSSDADTTTFTSKTGYSGASGDSFADGGAGLDTSSGFDASKISSSGVKGGESSDFGTDSSKATTAASGGAVGSDDTDVDKAPNYAATVSGAITSEGQYKPKGDNLTEGDVPQTKTFTGDVGGPHDPGRLAEKDFQKQGSDDLVSAGGLKYSGSGGDDSGTGQFDALSSERAPDRNI